MIIYRISSNLAGQIKKPNGLLLAPGAWFVHARVNHSNSRAPGKELSSKKGHIKR